MTPSTPTQRPLATQARQRWLLSVLLLAAFALRLYRLDAQDIWWDEARNIDVAVRPLTQIATAGELDIHPPLYFYLLHGWWRLTAHGPIPSGQDAFAVRFLSLWFGVLFVALMYALGRRIGGFWAGLGAAFGAAFLPFLLGEAQETRMYTMTLVWLAAAGLAVLQGAEDRGQASGGRRQGSGNGGVVFGDRGLFRPDTNSSQPASVGHSLTAHENAAEHPERRAAARSRRMRSGHSDKAASFDCARPPSTSLRFAQAAVLRSGCLPVLSAMASRYWPWLLFALFSALALLTHYAAVFALIALWGWAGVWALAGGRAGLWPRLRTVLLAGLVTALFCLPGLPIALRQIPAYRNPNLVVPSLSGYLAELARVYSLGEHMDLAVAQPWMMALAALLIGGWLVGMTNQRIGESANHDAPRVAPFATRHSSPAIRHSLFVLLWSLLPLAVYYLVIMDRSTFATRYIAGALPGWLLLVGLAVAGWARLGRVGGAAASLALAVILAPGLIGDLTDPRFFREDTRGLVAWLRQATRPARDIILADQRYPLGLYWPRWNGSAIGMPPAQPADLAPAQYLFVDINTVAERLSALAHGRERVFLVRWFESDTDPRSAASWVLEKFGAQLGQQNFRGYQVTWYAVPPAADFELAPALDGPPAIFGEQVRLEAYAFGGRGPGLISTAAETRAPQAPADQPVWVVVRWARLAGAVEPGKALPRGLKATVVLEDIDGTIVGRDDRPILNDRHLAPLEWTEADRPLGVYLVRAASAMPPGTYAVKLAVYDPLTLAQLPASGAAARGTFVTLGQVTLARPTQPTDVAQLPIDAPLTLAWGGVRLLGRGPLPAQISPGDRLSFDLFWQAEQDSLPELRVQLMLRPAEPGGTAAAQWEAPLVKGHPTGAWQAGDVVRGRQQLSLKPDMPAGDYQLTLRLADVAGTAISPPTTLGQVTVAGRPHVFEPPTQMGQRSGARFGDLAILLGYDLIPPAGRGEPVAVTLYWRAEAASAVPYAVSVQLLDGNGVLRAQRDQQPGDGAFPTTGWVPGEVLTDPYQIWLQADETAIYTLIVKMYNPTTGEILPVTLIDGTPAGDFLRLGEVAMR